jgi:hypothetical protein
MDVDYTRDINISKASFENQLKLPHCQYDTKNRDGAYKLI